MQTIFTFALIYNLLQVVGMCLLGFACIIALVMIGYIQTTWNMTEEEKKALDDYIKENGFFSDPDDFF